jgi:hypothetical protein
MMLYSKNTTGEGFNKLEKASEIGDI